MPFMKSLADDAEIYDVYALHEERFANWPAFTAHIMRTPSSLDLNLRQLISAYVSGLNACDYCYGAHRIIAIEFGFAPEIVEGLIADVETAPVADNLKPLMAYLRKLTLEPYRIIQADADAVYAAGWDERALSDAITVASLFAFVNRMAMGHGVLPLTEERAEARGRELHGLTFPDGENAPA